MATESSDEAQANRFRSSASGALRGPGAFVRDWAFRIERRLARRYSDVELRQLRALERAYNGRRPPELLVFGDSAMFWTTHQDNDRRHLVDMIRGELDGPPGVEALVGPGYNARVVMAFLGGLEHCASRPKVVLVPASVIFATSLWLAHPVLGWERVAAELAAVAQMREGRPKRLERPGPAEEDAFDRLPAPSLIGARRTAGEHRLITNSPPATRWQQVVRLRALLDFYNAERLEPDSPGVQLVAEMGRRLTDMGLASVAYIPPVNQEVISKALGEKAHEHVERNASLVEAAYNEGAGPLGTVVNAIFASPAGEYMDPIHLTEAGRYRLAVMIADAVRPILQAAD